MIRPLECFIGLRYLRTGRGRGFVSFMSLASLAGMTLGVAALIVILSAMNGLEAESRDRLLSMAEHATVRPGDGAAAGREPDDLAALAASLGAAEGVTAVAPFVRIEAMLSSGGILRSALVRGIDPAAEPRDSELAAIVGPARLASLEPGANRVLLGRFLALNLRVGVGDRIEVFLPTSRGGRIALEQAGFTVAGIFEAGVEAHDANLALVHLGDASRLAGLGGAPEGLALTLAAPMEIGRVQRTLEPLAGPGFVWSNWAEENRSLFQAMAIEKVMMTVLLMLVVVVAAFNIVTSLTMTVNEKKRDIAILRTLGLEPGKVMRIFLVQGAAIGIGGMLAGLTLGVVLALNLETILPWLERTFGFQIMPGDVFYVTQVPSEVQISDVAVIACVAFALAVLATVLPSRRATRIDPAEVLRYE